MNQDGNIDYSQYDLQQLKQALSLIKRARYPRNFQNLQAELLARSARGEAMAAYPPRIDSEAASEFDNTKLRNTTPGARPRLVWAITLFYFFGAMLSVFGYYVAYSGRFDLPIAMQELYSAFTVVDHAQTVIGVALNLSATVCLFRMRRLAPYLFTAGLGLGVVNSVWHVVAGRWGSEYLEDILLGSAGGAAIALLVCAYSWSLLRRGSLR